MANLNDSDILLPNDIWGRRILEKVKKEYGLKILNIEFPPSISFTSKKLILNTDQGSFFLKEKPFYSIEPSQLKRSFLFQEFCSLNSSLVPKILKTISGEFYINLDNKVLFLTQYIVGRNFNGTNTDLVKILGTLKEINNLGTYYFKHSTENINYKYFTKNGTPDITIPLIYLKNNVKNKTDKNIFNLLNTTFEFLKNEYNKIPIEQYSVSHCDCTIFNFLLSHEKTLLNDFDNVKVMPRIHDLAEFFVSNTLINYTGEITNLRKPIFLKPSARESEIILENYRHNFQLSEKEKELFPICVEIIWLWTIALSVIKEDYIFADLLEPMSKIKDRSLNIEIKRLLKL